MRLSSHTMHRAVLRELLAVFALGLLTFNFILVTEKFLNLAKLFASVGASLGDLAKILVLFQPQITVLTMPIAFLMAVLLTYGRMNADNEIVVLRASGMSFGALSRPVFLFGAGCFALSLLASFWAAPLGAKKLRETVSDILARRAPLAIEEGIFNTSFRDVVVFVGGKTADGRLRDIFVYDGRRKDGPAVLVAREATVGAPGGASVSFDLRDGQVLLEHGEGATEVSFGRYAISFPLAAGDSQLTSRAELSPPGLLGEAAGAEGEERRRLLLEFHRRLSLPSLCLIMMLLGPPLSLWAGRSGKLGGLALGMLVFALYYAGVVYTEGLAATGALPVWLGAWLPAAVLGAASAWMFRRAASR
jgi:lipopolysaccharide export system permease protein